MSEVDPLVGGAAPKAQAPASAGPEAPGLGRGLTLALICVALVGFAAVLYVMVAAVAKPSSIDPLKAVASGAMSKLKIPETPTLAPDTPFVDAAGQPLTLEAFKGKVVVLNLWATWCAPCRKEMPTLARLQAAYVGKPVAVVAVSLDAAAQTDAAKAFIAQYRPLAFYQDAKFNFLTDLKPTPAGFPTTILFDRSGQERAIMSGEADWASPEARAVVEQLSGG
jgi:thiol-disulfide isomerase/thioredoxin